MQTQDTKRMKLWLYYRRGLKVVLKSDLTLLMFNGFSSVRFCLLVRVEENFLSGKLLILFVSYNAFLKFFSLMLCKPLGHKGFTELKETYLKWHSPKNKGKPSQTDLTEIKGKSLRPTKWGFPCRIFSYITNAMHLQSYLNQDIHIFFLKMKIHRFLLLYYTLSPALYIIMETM